jgi:hypothetical protein
MENQKEQDKSELEYYYRELQRCERFGESFKTQEARDNYERALSEYKNRYGSNDYFIN